MKFLTPGLDGGGDQATRFDGVVQVVAERIGDGIRHHDRPGEMDDRCHAVSADRLLDEIGIGDVGDDERRPRRDGPAEPGRQVVDDDDLFASIQKLQHHVAADVAGAACNQHAHGCNPTPEFYRHVRGFAARQTYSRRPLLRN